MSITYKPNVADTGSISELLEALSRDKIHEAPRLVVDGSAIEIPPQLAQIFKRIFEDFSEGKAVSIVSHDAKMTTQEAADFLGISRPTLIKMLTEHGIPIEQINRHRRIAFTEVLRLRDMLHSEQRLALRRIRSLEDELGMVESES